MRQVIVATLAGVVLGGCLEDVEPLSGFGNSAASGVVTLSWLPPTENSDGSPLLDLAGYTIYVGMNSSDYNVREIRLDNPGLTAYVVDGLEPGTYYFAATALNSSGMESAFSGEVVRTVD